MSIEFDKFQFQSVYRETNYFLHSTCGSNTNGSRNEAWKASRFLYPLRLLPNRPTDLNREIYNCDVYFPKGRTFLRLPAVASVDKRQKLSKFNVQSPSLCFTLSLSLPLSLFRSLSLSLFHCFYPLGFSLFRFFHFPPNSPPLPDAIKGKRDSENELMDNTNETHFVVSKMRRNAVDKNLRVEWLISRNWKPNDLSSDKKNDIESETLNWTNNDFQIKHVITLLWKWKI